MAKKGKIKIVIRKIDPNAWMVTFSDMLTLMLTFFVMLLTMSSMDTKKFHESFGVLTLKPRVLEEGGSTEVIAPNIVPLSQDNKLHGMGDTKIATESEAYHELLQLVKIMRETNAVEIEITDQGIVVRFHADVIFKPNSAELTLQGEEALRQIAPLLRRISFPLKIEGHTAAPPAGPEDPKAAMGLSVARAHSVLYFLIEQGGLDPGQLHMTGYGAIHPRRGLKPADPRNNRVNIMIDTKIHAFNL